MAKGSKIWNADNLPADSAFKFQVTDAADILKEASENFVHHQAEAWRQVRRWADDQMEIVEVQEGGSPNGPGASLALTEHLRTELPKLLRRYAITSLLDVACGDLNWMRHVDLSMIANYFGWDIDEELIIRAQTRAAEMVGHPHTWFEVRNVAETSFPNVDCILARHILIHFPNDYITAILDRIRDGHATYLLASNFPDATNDFVYDPTRYAWMGYMERPVNLELPPFNLKPAVAAITEQSGPAGVLTENHELALYRLHA